MAQEIVPTLKGEVEISIIEGTFSCSLSLHDIPNADDYLILINTGMNIESIKDDSGSHIYSYQRVYNDSLSDECFGYYIPSRDKGKKFLPSTLLFKYVGKFPVVADTGTAAETGDWKGNIAFNGRSVRADGRQTAWYPVLYDLRRDKRYFSVKCDIEVSCKDCNNIYVNGSEPKTSRKARFKTDSPLELMLFAGTYDVVKVDGTYYLNPDITKQQMIKFSAEVTEIKQFYETNLKIRYQQENVFIQTTPVSKLNSWLFVCYPTIVNVGHGTNGLRGFFKDTTYFSNFLAHELAHYYFGYYKKFNSELADMLSEGFSEYLSMLFSKRHTADSVYKVRIARKIRKLSKFQPVPIASVKNADDMGNRELYVYNYIPLLFTALETEVGIDAMWTWMHNILTRGVSITNYAFLERAFRDAIKDDSSSSRLLHKYFASDSTLVSIKNAIE